MNHSSNSAPDGSIARAAVPLVCRAPAAGLTETTSAAPGSTSIRDTPGSFKGIALRVVRDPSPRAAGMAAVRPASRSEARCRA